MRQWKSAVMQAAWPFEDPPNVAVLTTSDVVRDGDPILLVTRDAQEGDWQFLAAPGASMERAMLVALSEIVELDATVTVLADLPQGWRASRAGPGSPWIRERCQSVAADEG
jgi:hypothetical protein